jgi:hypothetical protein
MIQFECALGRGHDDSASEAETTLVGAPFFNLFFDPFF